jgi:hypothetical protein
MRRLQAVGAALIVLAALSAPAIAADVVYIGTVTGHFFANPTNSGGFTAKPGDTEVFTQTFPAINFNPPAGTVPCTNATGVHENLRPFTDVVPQPDGSCLVIVAEGNGQQAGVGDLYNFNAVFRGQLSVSAAAVVTFNFFSDDGWILSVDAEKTSHLQPTHVSGPMVNPPPAGPFSGYPVVGSYNTPSSPAGNNLVVNFPAAGTYAFELDYSECCAGQLALTLTANGVAITPSYTIFASAGPGGTIDPMGDIAVASNASQAFAVTADPGHAIADVLVDDVSVGPVANYTFPNVTSNHTIAASFTEEAVNSPPDCGKARAMTEQLWPPNHKLAPVVITGVTDPDHDPVTITVTGVTQDEPLNELGDGNTCPDAVLIDGAAQVRAERSGKGNGRVYVVAFTADDGQGGVCNGSVKVCVPHDESAAPPASGRDPDALRPPSWENVEEACVDDGQSFNSLGPCDQRGHIGVQAGVTLIAGRAAGGTVSLEYFLPAASDVSIALYDVAGRRVAGLARTSQSAGTHQASLDLPNLANGIYFARLQAGAIVVSRSVLIHR